MLVAVRDLGFGISPFPKLRRIIGAILVEEFLLAFFILRATVRILLDWKKFL